MWLANICRSKPQPRGPLAPTQKSKQGVLTREQTHLLQVGAGKLFPPKRNREHLELRSPPSCLETQWCFKLPELRTTSSHRMSKPAPGKTAKLSATRSQRSASLSTSAVGGLPSLHISQVLQTLSPFFPPCFWYSLFFGTSSVSTSSLHPHHPFQAG